jgi:4-amino-4-deoxy-L-arabinose transferase-like glycosyltransferase
MDQAGGSSFVKQDLEDTRTARLLLLIFLAALALRLGVMVYSGAYRIEDTWDFGFETGRIADSIVKGQGFASPCGASSGPSAWLMPVYPYVVAVVFKLFGSYSEAAAIALICLNSVASAVTCVLILLVASRLFGATAGLVAAACWVVFPPSIWHSVNSLWNTTFFTCLATLLLYLTLVVSERTRLRAAVLYGLALGFVALLNASIVALYPFFVLWLFFRLRTTFVRRTLFAGLVFSACMIAMSPWLIRNHMVFGRWMLRSNFGLELRIGNNERVWQAIQLKGKDRGRMVHWVRDHPCQSGEEFSRLSRLGEVEYSRRNQEQAIEFIRDNPEKFLDLTVTRIGNFWLGDLGAPKEYKGNLELPFSVSNIKDLSLLVPLPVMLIGIFRALKRKIPVFLPMAYLLFFPLIYYFVHTHSHRYRHPIEPVIIMFGAYGACALIDWCIARTGRGTPGISEGGS